jgi:23S rRNA-/tRNA-specific pseudouridylate synthase
VKESRLNSTVVFQNADFVVVSKPTGLNFHSEESPDTVFDSLSQTHILYSGSKGLPLFKTANTM